ncbi:DEAD/DEAH box helicase [Archangium sp.]|uniref:DEAD/DEAH box helicase n=1 Tax=Archangium sp. TaxID=1872627 RepID=UPI00389A456D
MNASYILKRLNQTKQLNKQRLIEIATELDVVDTSGTINEIATRVGKSLARRHDEDTGRPQGSDVARQQVLELLDWDELASLLRSEGPWLGEQARYEFTETIDGMTRDALEELVEELFGAVNGSEQIDEICQDRRWKGRDVFEAMSYDEEDSDEEEEDSDEEDSEEEDSDEEDSDEEDSSEEEDSDEEYSGEGPAWQSMLNYRVGPDHPLPEGLTISEHQLFEHQQQSLNALAKWWSSEESRGVLCLPTGGGKTRTAVEFVLTQALEGGNRVLWLAHRQELVNQAIATFLTRGHRRGTAFTVARFEAGGRKHSRPADVVIASLPTLGWSRELPNVDNLLEIHETFDLIIVDECHHAVASTWKRLLKELRRRLPDSKLLGLSATPTRTAAREVPEFWNLFDGLIHEVKPLPLIKQGVLAKPHIITVETEQVFDATEKEAHLFEQFDDLPEMLVKRIASSKVRNELIVRNLVQERNRWGQTLLFAANLEHAEELERMLRKKGVQAGFLHGGSPMEQRAQVLGAFAARRFQVLINVALFNEGTDIPAVQTVFLARPTMSRILFQQMVGRGLRGPRLGGTATCYIVGFNDKLTNLLQDQLTSSFATERDALEALGLDAQEVEELVEITSTPVIRIQEKSPVATEDYARRLEELLRSVETMRVTGQWSPDELPLLGWWETSSLGGSHQYLPVFEGDKEALGARLGRLLQLVQLDQPLPEEGWASVQHIPEEISQAFARAVLQNQGALRYVDLSRSQATETQQALESMLQRGNISEAKATVSPEPSRPPLEFWLSHAARNGAVNDTMLVRMDSTLQAISPAHYERVNKVWSQHCDLLGSNPEPRAIDLFVRMASRFPEVAEVPAPVCEQLLTEAARRGALPTPMPSNEQGPTLGEVRQHLSTLTESQRRESLDLLYKAYFAGKYATREEFLMSLLAG